VLLCLDHDTVLYRNVGGARSVKSTTQCADAQEVLKIQAFATRAGHDKLYLLKARTLNLVQLKIISQVMFVLKFEMRVLK